MKPGISYKREVELPIYYDGKPINTKYRADFTCFGDIVVELKAIDKLTSTHDSQVLNYLKASRIEKGLLLNLGSKSLEQKRFILKSQK